MVALPEGQRRALVAVGFLGYSYAEAAILFRCSIGTIKSRVSRARMALLDALQRQTPRKPHRARQAGDEFVALIGVVETMKAAAKTRSSGQIADGAQAPRADKG